MDVTDNPAPGGLQYPRVLIVLMPKVKADDPPNLLIRTQFGAWPKARLAQIHATGDASGHGEFCGRYYRLQACDRFFGCLFGGLRAAVSNMVAPNEVVQLGNDTDAGLLRRWVKVVKKRLGDGLISTGYWEVIFHVRLSRAMVKFVEDFNPDLIYCQGYSLGFATLPLLIARRFKLPICFQTTDDWPQNTYRNSLVGWMLRRRARELITGSCVRLAFGEKMRQAYQQRYGVAFEATYHLDDPRRFSVHESGGDGSGTTILYVGGLGHRRYEAIEDLTAAVQELSGQLGQIRIKVLCRGIPKEMPRGLLCSAEVDFGPLPSHDELPKVLVGATVLFLPESFTESPAAIEYSLSTKAHLYMSSGRPVLVYGPAYSGTVDYALREGWGVVVAERNVTKLKEALAEMIIGGGGKECNLRRNAQMCLINHHDVAVGQERFRILLSKCVCC